MALYIPHFPDEGTIVQGEKESWPRSHIQDVEPVCLLNYKVRALSTM